MRRLLDTNVLIDWFNRRDHEDLVLQTNGIQVLSSVVEMELRATAAARAARRELEQFVRAFEACGRRLTPDPSIYAEAGPVLLKLRSQGREVRRASQVNDVLIALTARAHGATLYTRDGEDYEAIRRIRPFELRVMDDMR